MKKILSFAGSCVIAAALASSGLTANINQSAGTTSGEFLRIGAGARPAGMGEAYAAMASDVYSLYWNPAGLAQVRSSEILMAHTMWYLDVSHEYVAYVRPLGGNKGAVGVSVTYLMTTFEKRNGDTEAADSSGNVGDMAVGVSYGRTLIGGIGGGITAKYISSKLDTYNASAMAFDVGFKKALPFWNEKITAGLAISNLGGSLKYIANPVAIGTIADLGLASKNVYKNLSLALDVRTVLNGNSDPSFNAGGEYVFKCTDQITLSPRFGFMTGGSRLTAGFGFSWEGYQLDYAFSPHADLGTSNRISLSAKF